MNDTSRNRLANPKLIGIAILLLTAVYLVARPSLENWLGTELPAPKEEAVKIDSDVADPSHRQGTVHSSEVGTNTATSKFKLTEIARDTFESPAGLIYGPGRGGEHRIDHVMRHAHDIPRRDIHGVFDANQQTEILQLIDEAYRLVLEKSNRVKKADRSNRLELTIQMQRRIGYEGGEAGRSRRFPVTTRLRLVLDGQHVITAYPIR